MRSSQKGRKPAAPPKWDIDDLPQLQDAIWRELASAAANPKAAWHWPTVATVRDADETVEPALRTVVLRAARDNVAELEMHSDVRADKVAELRTHPALAWHFYDPRHRVQLRAGGRARIHTDDDVADAAWAKLSDGSRRIYCATATPGSPLDEPSNALPAALKPNADADDAAVRAAIDGGRSNFAVVIATVELMQFLHLRKDGHRRARFDRTGGEATWVVP